MKTILLILLALTITTLNLKAEPLTGQAKLDSLLAELPKAKGDTNEVNLLNTISSSYYSTNPDKGIEYGLRGVKLSKEFGWGKGEAKCYSTIGVCYGFGKSNYPKALEYFGKALKINEQLGNKRGVANNLGNMGGVYSFLSDNTKALEYYSKALKIDEELKDKRGVATNLVNMGIAYGNLSDYPKALEYYSKSLKIYEEIEDMFGAASSLGNIGGIYINQTDYPKALEYYSKALKINEEIGNINGVSRNIGNIGNVYILQSDYPKALEYFDKALRLFEELGDKLGIAFNLGSMGNVYILQSNYPKALEYLGKALKIFEELGDKNSVASVLGNMGELYFSLSQDSTNINPSELNDYVSLNKDINLKKSIEYFLQSIKIFEEIGELHARSLILNNLAVAFKQKGEMTKAYEALEKHQKFKDSVFSQEKSKQLAALEKAREDDVNRIKIEKQEVQIAAQEKERDFIIYSAAGGIVSILVILGVIFNQRRKSDKLLYNVLPITIAKRLKKKEHPISDYFTQASIIFIDIVGFTSMSQDADPRNIVIELNKIFTKYDTIANKYGLEKIKTIGDSYMAAAGIPEVQKDNTHRAAQMALEVKAMMEDYHTADGTKIEVRIGLDCGPVVAGVIGENKFIYDMWSDAVNTASRMESSSIAGEVHVSERFKEAVTEYEEFSYVERGEIEIKGKGKMKTFFMGSKEVEAM